MNEAELTKIRKAWEKETDDYLLKAYNEDLNNYPEEVQQIIKDEYERRCLGNLITEEPSGNHNRIKRFLFQKSTAGSLGVGGILFLFLALMIGKAIGHAASQTLPPVFVIVAGIVFLLFYWDTKDK